MALTKSDFDAGSKSRRYIHASFGAPTAMIAKPFSHQQLVDAAALLFEQPADVRRLRE